MKVEKEGFRGERPFILFTLTLTDSMGFWHSLAQGETIKVYSTYWDS